MNKQSTIQFKKMQPDAIIPTRGTPKSAGFDLYSLNDYIITGGMGSVMIATGIAVQLPEGTYGRIAARSGLALREHLAVNAGVVDIDYASAIGVVAYVTKNDHQVVIKRGDKIAQLIPEIINYATAMEVDMFFDHDEVHLGWGSTDVLL